MNRQQTNKTAWLLVALGLHVSAVHAELIVSGGCMKVMPDTFVVSLGKIAVKDGACVDLVTSAAMESDTLVQIDDGGRVEGSGTVMGNVENHGLILANGGTGTGLSVIGDVTNHGIVRAHLDSAFDLTGNFTNELAGILDLIFSPSALPANLSGPGETVTANTLPSLTAPELSSGNPVFQIELFPGHNYRVERSSTLALGSWMPITSDLNPTERASLTITDTEVQVNTTSRVFYRYQVDEQDPQ